MIIQFALDRLKYMRLATRLSVVMEAGWVVVSWQALVPFINSGSVKRNGRSTASSLLGNGVSDN